VPHSAAQQAAAGQQKVLTHDTTLFVLGLVAISSSDASEVTEVEVSPMDGWMDGWG
jgi:hypothetical protein